MSCGCPILGEKYGENCTEALTNLLNELLIDHYMPYKLVLAVNTKLIHTVCSFCALNFVQDFEALTPNLLARTVETVEGGGLIVLLLRTVSSLKQLYTMAMVCVNF